MPGRRRSLIEAQPPVAWMILAIAFGCGDGVGRPIQQDASPSKEPAVAGSSAMAGAGDNGRSSRSVSASAGTNSQSSGAGGAEGSSTCSSVIDWDPSWAAAEDELLLAINLARAAAFDCISGDSLATPPPQLNLSPALRCAARLHSASQHTLGSAESRLEATNVLFAHVGEVVATTDQTNSDPAFVLIGWLLGESALDCIKLTDPAFTSVGIGFAYLGDIGYWTVDLGGGL